MWEKGYWIIIVEKKKIDTDLDYQNKWYVCLGSFF